MTDIKTAEYIKATSFICPHCGKCVFCEYTLELTRIGYTVAYSDVIECDHCGQDVRVIEKI